MNKFLTVFALAASVLLVGCQQEESSQPVNQDKKTEQTASQQKKSKWGYELADEVWQDTKSYNSPRIAFIWGKPPIQRVRLITGMKSGAQSLIIQT
ncbi:hypothetical protein [Zooshikella ganghwensis]|uniref:Uncharacterized protein n=1 Tax=Zooshikella ganghwensis TaxID=202772 RepID=A0A4P9VI54_9GAMM|nr:hypothetical protein [Zooshikella ganghwensis]RDH42129.1 hypothetical protein B9G39_00985 [Zooshikella ganghwensis]